MDVFSRYAPFIRDFIYQNNWQSLRAVQAAAGDAIFGTDENVLLTASTASGKTEAAFFPILTLLCEQPSASVGALYIAPLKALINDQFGRLNDLCREGGIPVWHWHGDVAQSHKNRLLKNPSGILQITPESLEALLLHKHAYIPRLFCDLRFIVIDEVHSLLRGDRGAQTLCLMERLSRTAGVNPRRIGLSATLGDPSGAGAYLSSGTGRGCIVPRIQGAPERWRLSVEHFYVGGADAPVEESDAVLPSAEVSGFPEKEESAAALPPASDGENEEYKAPRYFDGGYAYIFEHTRGRKCLVFVNSREECEAVTTTLKSYCEAVGEDNRFLIHHGNLSASFREGAESAMKDDEKLQTTVTTSTLELGIDIGRLERAFQLGAPFTVSSFLQRMGRTGRRGTPPEMRFVIREEMPEARNVMPVSIPWTLLQALALIELYRKEKWVEPINRRRLPFSLLYHQTMATLASEGEMSPAALASRVLNLAPFSNIDREDYRVLLRHLIETNHLQRLEDGGLIVGLAGERQINSFKFYAVFKENEEYTVRSASQELGTLVMPPPPGDKIAIAGSVWLVEEVDYKRRIVYCEEVKGKVPAYFGLCPGDINTRVLQKMREILTSDEAYPYVMKKAAERLSEGRQTARVSGLIDEPLVFLGGDMWCLFPWLGTYAFLALERFLKLKCASPLGISAVEGTRPYFILFKMKASSEEFFRFVTEEAEKELDSMELLYDGEIPLFEKYDDFVPPALVRKGFAYGVLDVNEMKNCIFGWKRFAGGVDDG